MKTLHEIGPCPSDEGCAQADGTEEYKRRALLECTVFKNQIRRQLGYEPDGSKIIIKSFPHDSFMSIIYYYEVCYEYDDECKEHIDYFYKIDNNYPQIWDEEAKHEM